MRALKRLLVALMHFVTWAPIAVSSKRVRSESVLIVRPDLLGDFFIWSSVFRIWRDGAAKHHVTLACAPSIAQVARLMPEYDDVYEVDWPLYLANRQYRAKVMRDLRSRGFEYAVAPLASRSFLTSDLLVHATGAPVRVCATGDSLNENALLHWLGRAAYTVAFKITSKEQHQRQFDFAMCNGLAEVTRTKVELNALAEYRFPFDGTFQVPKSPYVLVLPGTSDARRQYPSGALAQVVQRLSKERKLQVVICGTIKEAGIIEEFRRVLGPDHTYLCDATSVFSLTTLIQSACLVLCNETGPAHLAEFLRRPCIVIAGGGHFGRFVPYTNAVLDRSPASECVYVPMNCFGCNWKCSIEPKASTWPCIRQINTEEIFVAAIRAMSKAA